MTEKTIVLPPTPAANGHDAAYRLTVMVPKRRYFSYLRERWWVVVVFLALMVGGVVAFETLRNETYSSFAQLYVTSGAQVGSVFADARDDFATQIELLKGSHLRSAAMAKLGPRAAQLKSPISVEAVRPMGTTILQLRATGPEPALTQAFLEALIEEYKKFKKDTRVSTTEDLLKSLDEEITKREEELKAEQDKWVEFQKTNTLALLEEEAKSASLWLNELNVQLRQLNYGRDLLLKGLNPTAALAPAGTNQALAASLAVENGTNNLAGGAASMVAAAGADTNAVAAGSIGAAAVGAPGAGVAAVAGTNTLGVPPVTGVAASNALAAVSGTNALAASTTSGTNVDFYAASDAAMKSVRLELALALADRAKSRYPENSPMARPEVDRIERLRQTLVLLEKQAADQRHADLIETQNRIAAIEARIPEVKKQVLEASDRLSESQRHRNELQRVQGRYDGLMAMYQNIDLSKNIAQERTTELDPASAGQPEQRSLPFRIFLAVVGGLAVSMGLVFGWHLLDDRFVSVRDIKDQFGETVLGLVPQIRVPRSKPQEALLKAGDSRLAYAESYRHLRSALLLSELGEKRPQTVLLTGAGPSEGKSTIAANLARVLATSGLRVVLVDADLRGRGLGRLMGANGQFGVLDFLRGEADATAIVQPTEVPGLSQVPIGSHIEPGEGLFLRPKLAELFTELRRDRDFVILDSAPVLAADDAALLVPHADVVVMVMRPFYTKARLVRQALEMLYQRQAKQVAIVLNRARKDDLAGHYAVNGVGNAARNGKA